MSESSAPPEPASATGATPDHQEAADAPASPATSYNMRVGEAFSGRIAHMGDRDWIALTLQEGQSVTVTLAGDGAAPLADPLLRIHAAGGMLLAENDDISPVDMRARLSFTAPESATYYLSAAGYDDFYTGRYRLDVAAQAGGAPLPIYRHDQIAAYLAEGHWDGAARRFETGPGGSLNVDLTRLAAAGRDHALRALEAWGAVAGIAFVPVDGGVPGTVVHIAFDEAEAGADRTTLTLSGNRILRAEISIGADRIAPGPDGDLAVPGSATMQTYLQEVGHALGLGHAGDYDGPAAYGETAGAGGNHYLNDSWQASVMSGISQAANASIGASHARPVTPMIADILALRLLYGAAPVRPGDTIYGRGGTTGTFLDEIAGLEGAAAWTIADTGGIDLLDLSATTQAQRIDLRPETVSDIGGRIGTLAIARDTILEILRSGAGDDRITGNAAANRIEAGAGDDTVEGGEGNDQILGGAGGDRLSGGEGSDWIEGGPGADLLSGGAGSDWFVFLPGEAAEGDIVTDYGPHDRIYLAGTALAPVVSVSGGDVLVEGIRLAGAAAGDVTVIAQTGSGAASAGYAELAALLGLGRAGLAAFGPFVQHLFDADDDAGWAQVTTWFTDTAAVASERIGYDTGFTETRVWDLADASAWFSVAEMRDATNALRNRTETLDDGTTVLLTYDAAGTEPWATVRTTRAPGGALKNRTESYDDGRSVVTTYDFDASKSWARITETRTALGLQSRIETRDNGSELRITHDLAGQAAWSSIRVTTGPDGTLRNRTEIYDDGRQVLTSYDGANAHSWSQISETRTAAGLLRGRIETYDDGRSVTSAFDVEDAGAWASIVATRNAGGALIGRTDTQDDGHVIRTIFDPDDLAPWDRHVVVFAADGTVISDTYFF